MRSENLKLKSERYETIRLKNEDFTNSQEIAARNKDFYEGELKSLTENSLRSEQQFKLKEAENLRKIEELTIELEASRQERQFTKSKAEKYRGELDLSKNEASFYKNDFSRIKSEMETVTKYMAETSASTETLLRQQIEDIKAVSAAKDEVIK